MYLTTNISLKYKEIRVGIYRSRLKKEMCGRLRSRIWEERKGVMMWGLWDKQNNNGI